MKRKEADEMQLNFKKLYNKIKKRKAWAIDCIHCRLEELSDHMQKLIPFEPQELLDELYCI